MLNQAEVTALLEKLAVIHADRIKNPNISIREREIRLAKSCQIGSTLTKAAEKNGIAKFEIDELMAMIQGKEILPNTMRMTLPMLLFLCCERDIHNIPIMDIKRTYRLPAKKIEIRDFKEKTEYLTRKDIGSFFCVQKHEKVV